MAKWLLFFSLIFSLSAHAELSDQQLDQYILLCNQSKNTFDGVRTNLSTPPVINFEIYKTTFSDLCDFLVQIKKVRARIGDLSEKVTLLSKTKESWAKRAALAVAITSYAASQRNQNPNANSIGEIEDQREREELFDYYDSIGDGYNLSQIDLARFQNSRQESQKMDAFQRAVRQRAMVEDNLACPDGFPAETGGDEDLRKAYNNEIKPLSLTKEKLERKRTYYYQRLREIGPTFLKDNAFELYFKELEDLHATGIVLRIADKDVDYDAFEKREAKKEGDPAKLVKTKKKYKIQEFTSLANEKPFDDFKNHWSARWKDYVDQGGEVLEKNAQMADACIGEPGKPSVTDIKDYDAINALANYERACMNALKTQTENNKALIFNEVVERYRKYSYELGATKAKLLSLESLYLRRPIDETLALRKGGVPLNDRIVCNNQTLSEAEIKAAETKMLDVENQYRAIIAEEKIKDSMAYDEEQARKKKIAEEAKAQSKALGNKQKKEDAAVLKMKTLPY